MGQPLLLNTTTFCNAKCEFCIVNDWLNRPELNIDDEQVYRRCAVAGQRVDGSRLLGR